jgi:hypothetical protein
LYVEYSVVAALRNDIFRYLTFLWESSTFVNIGRCSYLPSNTVRTASA